MIEAEAAQAAFSHYGKYVFVTVTDQSERIHLIHYGEHRKRGTPATSCKEAEPSSKCRT